MVTTEIFNSFFQSKSGVNLSNFRVKIVRPFGFLTIILLCSFHYDRIHILVPLFLSYMLLIQTLIKRNVIYPSAILGGLIYLLLQYSSQSIYGWVLSVPYVVGVTFWDTSDMIVLQNLSFIARIYILMQSVVMYLLGDTLEAVVFVCIVLGFIQLYTSEIIHTYSQLLRELESASTSKDDFVSMISHEIRTPITSIIALSEILCDKYPLDREIQSLTDSSQILLKLLNNTLDWQKWVVGKMEIAKERVNLKSLVDTISNVMLPKAIQKDIELKIEVDPNLPLVLSDSLKIQSVLINLLGNAIKFTDAGEIDVKIVKVDENEKELMIRGEVSDTGIGISGSYLKNKGLFNPYSQSVDSVSRKYGGTGLGLALCKQIISALHGEITIESERGKGTKVQFTIPFVKSDELEEQIVAPKFNHDLVHSKEIHYCEDNLIIQRTLSKLMESAGFKVSVSSNGEECIRYLEKNPCSIIMIDKNMPVMDGLSATRILRKIYRNTIAILLLTADSNPLPREESQLFDLILTKPITRLNLLEALSKIMHSEQNTPRQDRTMSV